ncbi:MAG TPA: TRAP transporter small permease subunit [Azospirillum sp.]|nr:TRAP transporter small permease subunit [Azospirillum sp.]
MGYLTASRNGGTAHRGSLAPLVRLYDGLIVGLAAFGALCLAAVVVAIPVDVMMRNLGLKPMMWVSAGVEYAMLVAAASGGPWLVRIRGHVAVDSFVALLPRPVRRSVEVAVQLLAAGLCGLLAWRAGVLALEQAARGSVDIRAVDIPGWISYACLAVCFALVALEFVRLLLRGEGHGGQGGTA